MSSSTIFVALVAIACIFWSPAKVLSIITLLVIFSRDLPAALVALLLGAALFYFTKTKRK